MIILAISLAGVTLLLLASQMLCGFWLASHAVTPDGVVFHRNLGIGTGVFTVASLVTMMVMLLR